MEGIGTRISEINAGNIARDSGDYTFFKEGMSYAVPAGRKHQITRSNSGRDKGIVFSKNGEKGFREYDKEVVYWFTGPYVYIIGSRKEDTVVLNRF